MNDRPTRCWLRLAPTAFDDPGDWVLGLDDLDGPLHWRLADWQALLASCAGGPLLLLVEGCEIPPLLAERLQRCADLASGATAVLPWSDCDPVAMPFAPGSALAEAPVDVTDNALYSLADRQLGPIHVGRTPALLMATTSDPALAELANLSAVLDWWSAQESLCLCDHAYVQAPPSWRLTEGQEAKPRWPLPRAILRSRAAQVEAWQGTGPGPGLDARPVRLIITHEWGGGIERWCRDLIAADSGCHTLVLRASGEAAVGEIGRQLLLYSGAGLDTPLRGYALLRPIHYIAGPDAVYRSLLDEIIADFSVDEMVIGSLMGHSLDAIRTGLPTLFVFHDYTLFYDRLIGADGAGILPAGENPYAEVFGPSDDARGVALVAAFAQSANRPSVHLAAPDASVVENVRHIAPELADCEIQVIPHGSAEFGKRAKIDTLDLPGDRPRLLIPGRLWGEKGGDIVAASVAALSERWDMVLLGCGPVTQALQEHPHVTVIESYQRDDLPAWIDAIQPELAWLPSPVAETFGYLLSELQILGVPVAAFDRGSYANRIEHGRTGFLIAPQSDPAAALLAITPQVLSTLQAALAGYSLPTLADMGAAYRQVLGTVALPALRYRLRLAEPHDRLTDFVAQRQLQNWHAARKFQVASEAYRNTARDIRLELESERGHHRESIERLSAEIDIEREKHRASIDRLSSDVEQARSSAKEQIHALEQALDQQKVATSEAIAQSSTYRELLRAEQSRSQTAKGDLADLQQEHKELSAKAEWLHEQWQRVDTHRQQLLASRWWRLGAPVRAVSTAIRQAWASGRFRLGQARRITGRTRLSLRSRGLVDTARIAMERLRRPGQFLAVPAPVLAEFPPKIEAFALPGADQPTLSVIIPVYNKHHYTYACLRSMQSHWPSPATEVIVVDDASSDETPQTLALIDGIRNVRLEENSGFVGACRAGAAAARGQYLLFLNNDTTLTPGWADALLATYHLRDDVGLVGSKLVYPDGRLQEAGGIIFADGSGWNYGKFSDPNEPQYNYLRRADYCSGASILIENSFYQELGGFDTIYAPAYYEDTDLAFQVRAHGRHVYYQPASVVIHHEGITAGTDTGSGIKRHQVINQRTFLERWQSVLAHQASAGSPVERVKDRDTIGAVLIIDATIPMPDHDSGSVRMTALLEQLIALNYKVVFCPANGLAPDKYRYALQQLGVEVQHSPYFQPVRFFEQRGSEFQAIIVSRHYIAHDYLALIQQYAPQARLIFDTVDLHYLREKREAELDGREDDASVRTTRESELAIIAAADVTLVVSPVERDLLATDAPGAKVEVLSNIHTLREQGNDYAEREHIAFVGSYQHPPNIDAVQWFADAVWPEVHAALPEARFKIVGSRLPDVLKSLDARDGIDVVGFVEDLDTLFNTIRLSVAPLRYGAGVKGKVNTSMSYGVPVVVTPVAAEGMDLRDGEDVMMGADAQTFADAVIRLYTDAALWRQVAENGRHNIERHFSTAAARQTLARIIDPESASVATGNIDNER